MRCLRLALLASLVLTALACSGENPGAGGDGPPGGADLAGGGGPADLAAPGQDMVITPRPDLVALPDLAPEEDLALPPCGDTTESCGAPGLCVDCAASPMGRACVARACGCASTADCPAGTACDPGSRRCSPRCDDGAGGVLPCNGGCCDGKACVGGASDGACGDDGGRCAVCGAGTPTCGQDNGRLVCTPTCAPGGKGGAACGGGFCCGAQNVCVAVADGACGLAGSACVDCALAAEGPFCNALAGACGCAASGDCKPQEACLAGTCGAACDARNAPCNGGCCDPLTRRCFAGDSSAQCATSAACSDCGQDPAGTGCRVDNNARACGCDSAADCPAGQSCDLGTHACQKSCDARTPCNGGCCDVVNGVGSCVDGTDVARCGDTGGLCGDCVALGGNGAGGNTCVQSGSGGFCGCSGNGDCSPLSRGCDLLTRRCAVECSVMKPCRAGCCAIPAGLLVGMCVVGDQPAGCGAQGLCADCSADPAGTACQNGQCGCSVPGDCPAGTACNLLTRACENRCGDLTHTECNDACCAGNVCQPNTPAACGGGPNGACIDCRMSPEGSACVGGKCGCNATADCPGNTACNTRTHRCEVACGDADHTACNGGCCQIPNGQVTGTCAPGTANSACGRADACVTCPGDKPTCAAGACTAACGRVGDGACGDGNCCRNNLCVGGKQPAACGSSGACADCSVGNVGRVCNTDQPGGPWFCGCATEADCPAAAGGNAGQACNLQTKTCTSTCGVAGVTTPCNAGCCQVANGAGTCQPGTATAACGAMAGMCSDCAANCNQTPTCSAGACGCCAAVNSGCNANNQCCTNRCNNGRCACNNLGQACGPGGSANCCVGFGQILGCSAQGNCCLAQNSGCLQNNQCCSGTCRNFRCQ